MLKSAFKTSLFILKLVIPFYIIADTLIYFEILQKISFLFTPITNLLGLSPETSLAITAGVLLNIYSALAFAVPLNLSPYEWTILGLFIGIAHALPLENAIMKKIGLSYIYSTILRLCTAFLAVFIFKLLAIDIDGKLQHKAIEVNHYNSFLDMLYHSFINASILAVKIIVLISILIFVMHFIKEKLFKNKKISTPFSIITGLILGITYGAVILIQEKTNLTKNEILFVGTFLMICHSIIEDVALFVIFGANMWVLIFIRLFLAIIVSFITIKFIKLFNYQS
jgi:hypothetical protein